MKPRLLFIGYEFPPRIGPHALRLAHFCKHLAEAGWEIDVVACSPEPNIQDQYLAALIPPEVRITRIPTPRIWKGSALWALSAMRHSIKIVKRRKSVLVLTSAPQFAAHLAGHWVARRTGLPWVADYGDPFTYHPGYQRSSMGQAFTHWLEGRWLRRMDAIVVTTEETAEHYRRTFSKVPELTAVVPLGYDPEETQVDYDSDSGNGFTVTFAGSFQKNTPRPIEFLKGVARACSEHPKLVDRLRIEFIKAEGVKEEAEAIVPTSCRDVLSFTPFLPYEEMLARLKASSCLLVFGISGGLQLSSKVCFYIGLKTPILGVLGDPHDPLKRIIETHNRGLAVSNSADDVANALMKLHALHEQSQLDAAFSTEELEQYTWKHLTSKLDDVLRTTAGLD